MKRLNREYRKHTGATSVSGVSLQQKMNAVFERHGVNPPHVKKDRVALANDILCGRTTKPKPQKSVRQRTDKTSTPAKDFYASWEWKKARYEALKIHGRRCQCCGWRPGDTSHGHLVVDHIKPRSKFPSLELDVSNMQVLCNDCNMGKSNVYADDFRDLDSWLAKIAHD